MMTDSPLLPVLPEVQVGHSINHFGTTFLHYLETDTNTIFSPLSLVTALYIISLGSKGCGIVHRELDRIINYSDVDLDNYDLNNHHKGLAAIYKYLSGNNGHNLNNTLATRGDLSRIRQRKWFKDSSHDRHQATNESKSFEFNVGNLFLYQKRNLGLKKAFTNVLDTYYNITLAQYKVYHDLDSDMDKVSPIDALTKPVPITDIIVRGSKERLCAIVNHWVATKTKGNIKELLKCDDSIDIGDIFMNAVHLKAKWKYQYFDVKHTEELAFFNEGKKLLKTKVPFMKTSKTFRLNYYDSERYSQRTVRSDVAFEALEIPYEGSDSQTISLVLLLPKNMSTLPQLEKQLGWQGLEQIYGRFSLEKVEVVLPKFKFDKTYEMKSLLTKMGAEDLFSYKGKPTEIFEENNGEIIKDILHKAMIQVDETGVEAAASTAVLISPRSMNHRIVKFVANHPFLFVVRHIKTNTAVFIGRVTKF